MSFQRRAMGVAIGCVAALSLATMLSAQAQTPPPVGQSGAPAKPTDPAAKPTAEAPPADYVIGIDDALTVNFWRDKDMSADVVVRPDGKITLPLLNEIYAAGLTPEQLRAAVVKASMKFLTEEPTVSIIVKQINSRVVYITGQVGKSGPHPLVPHMTVVTLISLAGGVGEYAHTDRIQIVRTENGQQKSYFFNYKDFMRGKPEALKQNIELKIGDTVIVP